MRNPPRKNTPAQAPFSKQKTPGTYWMSGNHCVHAALGNKARQIERLIALPNAGETVKRWGAKTPLETVDINVFQKLAGEDAVHQGVAALVRLLPSPNLEEILARADGRPLVVLDHVTDPHNIGAVMRSCAAFDAGGLIMTEDHAPRETAALAKAASGALEEVAWVRVVNLARTLETCKRAGYWVAGFDAAAPHTLREAKLNRKTVLVLGAEGKGMRRLTEEHCDYLTRLPMSAKMESLNVSNAAAIALYELFAGEINQLGR